MNDEKENDIEIEKLLENWYQDNKDEVLKEILDKLKEHDKE